MRILIAEDDPVSRRLLEATLVKCGYDVTVACDGTEALQVLQSKGAPRLAILDWMMPGMDGLTICRKIRGASGSQSTYIILLTARGQRDDIVAGLEAGADDYITKPFHREEFHARVQVGVRTMELHHMKDELISMVNHELRSPLTSIIGSLSMVASGETGELSKDARTMIDIAYRNSERLLRLVNNMLDIEKIESGKMEFHLQSLELMSLVEQAMEANSAYARQLEVELLLKDALPGAKVNGDSDRLMQVLTNLLTNAAKFSPANDAVMISVSRHNGAVRVAVADHGPGIPADFRDRIFQKFSQAQSPGARRKDGSGLGLNISKAIVEAMGGQIGFETEANVGTTFYFDLPEYHGYYEYQVLPDRIMGEGKILVMDDERFIRDITAEMLSSLGYKVTTSMHGADAIEVYQEAKESGQPYDAVIVDIVVPDGMGGEETIQKLVEIDPEVKAVAGSGYSHNPIMADFRKYGFSGAIAKPYEIRELSEVLHRVITGKE